MHSACPAVLLFTPLSLSPRLTFALRPRVSAEGEHAPSTTASLPMPSYCLTSNGHRYEEGDSWHDGCRNCYCHSGREMCVLISCPVPSCSHPVVRPDQCCPTCEGASEVFSNLDILVLDMYVCAAHPSDKEPIGIIFKGETKHE